MNEDNEDSEENEDGGEDTENMYTLAKTGECEGITRDFQL